jgi:hypothetical protein
MFIQLVFFKKEVKIAERKEMWREDCGQGKKLEDKAYLVHTHACTHREGTSRRYLVKNIVPRKYTHNFFQIY